MLGPQGRVDTRVLLERETQLARLEDALARAGRGEGAMVAIEAAAGLGKTSVLETAALGAAAAGITVLSAKGEDRERGLPWGLARRLLAPALEHPRNAAALSGVAASAAALFDRSAPLPALPPDDAALTVSHALVWAIANLAEDAPLLLCVDDVHWADEVSLRFLSYLLGRLAEMPVAVLVARRPRGAGIRRPLAEEIFADPRVERLRLAPLSGAAVATIVSEALGPGTGAELAGACATTSAGNPFYLHELLLELSSLPPDSLAAPALERIAPESVSRAIFVRLSRLGPDAAAFARAVAVLGESAAFAHAAELAGLEQGSATRAFDALGVAEILRPAEPLGFVHPLVAQAVEAEIDVGERGELHRAAARLLDRDGAGPESVALHLIQAGGRGDAWVVSTLREAAAQALAQGATEAAADWLARAVEEPPPAAERGPLLAELGRAEAALGRPRAAESLRQAAELAGAGEEAARICADLGRALALQGRADAAAAAFERGLEPARRPRLGTGQGAARGLVVGRHPGRGDAGRSDARARAATAAGGRDADHRRARAVGPDGDAARLRRPWTRGGGGAGRARLGRWRAARAGSCDGVAWSLVTGALLVADEPERCLEVCEAALEETRRRGSPMAFANASYCRAWPLFAQGRVSASVADSQAALAARGDGWSAFLGTATAILVLGLVERGELAQARQALALVEGDEALRASTQYPMLLAGEARLLVAEGRPEQALAQLLSAGEILKAAGIDCPSAVPWHADAALAAGLAGEREEAGRLAADALADARRGGAPTAIARALRAAARAQRGERAIELHREALAALDGLPPRLERIHALVDLGAALRRNRRRAEAREPLREALALAEAGGALALAATARVELAAAGARSTERRDGLAGLTPSERRVAGMAASGMSNREIAQALFVTVKAIEYHLANAYRKLDIDSRRQLRPLLAGEAADDGSSGR